LIQKEKDLIFALPRGALLECILSFVITVAGMHGDPVSEPKVILSRSLSWNPRCRCRSAPRRG
jgi:hypothetical protein